MIVIVLVSFEASQICFGRFEAKPLENVTISESEICLSLRSPTKQADHTITIPNVNIGKIIYHLGSPSTILLHVMEKVADYIRAEMQLDQGKFMQWQ